MKKLNMYLVAFLFSFVLVLQAVGQKDTSYNIRLKAKYLADKRVVELNWTPQEQTSSFIVERTVNGGKDWNVIAKVQADSDNFTDVNPVIGLSFYRVLQSSSTINHSNVTSVLATNSHFTVYPNVVNKVATIYSNDQMEKTIRIEIVNLENKLLKNVESQISQTRPFELNVSELPKGDYLLKINDQDRQYNYKLIVIKEDLNHKIN